MYRQQGLRQRPSTFRIDPTHPLANGLVFAGFGGGHCAGSNSYHDSSLYGNHGTLTAMDPATDWVWVPELNRFALDFVIASGQYVSSSVPAVTVEPLTICAWIYPTALTAIMGVAGVGQSAASRYWMLRVSGEAVGDPMRAMKYDAGGTGSYADAGTCVANTWQHGAAVFRSNTYRICYYNGIPGAAETTNRTDSTVTHTIVGSTRASNYYTFNGAIADAMIWSRELSSSEITAIADPSNVMYGGLILPPRRKLWAVNVSSTPSINSKRVMMRW